MGSGRLNPVLVIGADPVQIHKTALTTALTLACMIEFEKPNHYDPTIQALLVGKQIFGERHFADGTAYWHFLDQLNQRHTKLKALATGNAVHDGLKPHEAIAQFSDTFIASTQEKISAGKIERNDPTIEYTLLSLAGLVAFGMFRLEHVIDLREDLDVGVCTIYGEDPHDHPYSLMLAIDFIDQLIAALKKQAEIEAKKEKIANVRSANGLGDETHEMVSVITNQTPHEGATVGGHGVGGGFGS